MNPISSANGELHVHYHSALRWITAKNFKHHIGLGQIYSGVFQCFQHVVYDMNLMAAHQHLGHRLAVDEALQVQRLEMPMLLFLRLLEHSGLRMEHQTSSHFFTNSPSSQAYSAGKMKIMFTLANALGWSAFLLGLAASASISNCSKCPRCWILLSCSPVKPPCHHWALLSGIYPWQ